MATFAARSPAKVVPPRKRELESAPPMHAEFKIPRDEIARLAYEKFVARGCVHGYHEQDWFDAEDELRAEFRERGE